MKQPFENQIVVGDAIDWTVSLCDYSAADGYVLKYFFRGPQVLDLTSTASGSDFKFAETAANTAKLTPGLYGWQLAIFLNGARVKTLAQGQIQVIADLSAQKAGYDARSFAKKNLDAVEAVLLDRNARVESTYQFEGRMLSVCTHEQLIQARAFWKRQYKNEQIDAGEIEPDNDQLIARFC
ncbi:MAG: hypothetical protein JWO13_2274 [Acidobacteriales bacterium]|nr:hypothetical protein [Terriglobales bacterium]